MIGRNGERRSGISAQAARHDDDDDSFKIDRFEGMSLRVETDGPGDQGSISGRVIPNTQKMELDATLLNTQQYKVRIKGKVEQSTKRNHAFPYTFM